MVKSKRSKTKRKPRKNIHADANSSSESREIHILAKIEGHGGVSREPDGKQIPFIPTPNFHLHRSGIVLCGTLYLDNYAKNNEDIEIIKNVMKKSSTLDEIKIKYLVDEWVKTVNIRQIQSTLAFDRSPEFYEKQYGSMAEKIKKNFMLGKKMAEEGFPGVLTEEYYGEGTILADKQFQGRQKNDPPEKFIPETTEKGPALCIYGISVNGKQYGGYSVKTLPNFAKMSELHHYVKIIFHELSIPLYPTDVIHFHFLDTSCNYDDPENCSLYPLISAKNIERMKSEYENLRRVAVSMDIEEEKKEESVAKAKDSYEYESDEDIVVRSQSPYRAKINHEIGNEYLFYSKNDKKEKQTMRLVRYRQNAYAFKTEEEEKIKKMTGVGKTKEGNIVWKDKQGKMWICDEIKYEYETDGTYNFFIEEYEYDFTVKIEGKQARHARLLFMNKTNDDDGNEVYNFKIENLNKWYHFVIKNGRIRFINHLGKITVESGLCDKKTCDDDLLPEEDDETPPEHTWNLFKKSAFSKTKKLSKK